MDIKYNISFDASEFMSRATASLFPLLSQSVNGIAQAVTADWKEAVLKAKLWEGEKDAYAKSISYSMTGPFSAEVVADYKYAYEIETGRPAKDLKRMLDTSDKVRRTQDGRRFLVIPFRHNVADMPKDVRSAAKALAPSTIVGSGMRPAGQVVNLHPKTGMTPGVHSPYLSVSASRQHAQVESRSYNWGAKLTAGMMGSNATKVDKRKYGGMVRFDTGTPGANRSSYMTFRVMMEGSPGWIVPAKPGLFLAKKVVDDVRPKAELIFTEAVKRSINSL